MAKKFSEFLSELKATHPDLKLEDLTDDDGTPLPQVLTLYKEAGASKDQVRAVETKLTKALEVNEEWRKYGAYAQPILEQVQQGKLKPPSSEATGETKNILAVFDDPAYSPLKPVFSQVVNTMQSFAEGFMNFLQNDYAPTKQAAAQRMRAMDIAEMRAKHPDFDEEKVMAAAKKYGVNTWDGAYQAFKGENQPQVIQDAEKIAREKWEKEAKEKGEAARTETGGGGPLGGGSSVEGKPSGLESLGERVIQGMKAKGYQ